MLGRRWEQSASQAAGFRELKVEKKEEGRETVLAQLLMEAGTHLSS